MKCLYRDLECLHGDHGGGACVHTVIDTNGNEVARRCLIYQEVKVEKKTLNMLRLSIVDPKLYKKKDITFRINNIEPKFKPFSVFQTA